MARSEHKIKIPSSTRYLEDVRRFVEKHAQAANLPDDAVEKLKIAVDEACTNIIKHAYQGDSHHNIDLAVIIAPDRFTVRIRDEGRRFDPSKYVAPNILESIKKRRAGGYGVHIIRQLMDQVEYRSQGKVNEVRLTKFRLSPERYNGDGNL